jgi:ribonucleotide monophosphatase NagD (HAD superfamily)
MDRWQGEGSSLSADDVIKFARELSIPVYFITSASKSTKEIARIAKRTGGLTKSAEKKQFN